MSIASDCSDTELVPTLRMRYPRGWGEDAGVERVAARAGYLPARGTGKRTSPSGCPTTPSPATIRCAPSWRSG